MTVTGTNLKQILISKLKLPHWLSKKISVLKISFFIVHFTLDQTGVLEIEETLLQRTNLLYVNNQHTQTSNLYSIHQAPITQVIKNRFTQNQ